jgi:hypothetical protein
MNTSYHLSEFGSFTRARQIVGGITLLLALTLAGPPRLWGQCQLGVASFTLDESNIIALTVDSTGLSTGTITLNCPYGGPENAQVLYLQTFLNGVNQGGPGAGAQLECNGGSTTCPVSIRWSQNPSSTTTYAMTAWLWPTNSTASAPLTVTPLIPSVKVSPSQITGAAVGERWGGTVQEPF